MKSGTENEVEGKVHEVKGLINQKVGHVSRASWQPPIRGRSFVHCTWALSRLAEGKRKCRSFSTVSITPINKTSRL
jgi:hypothetical protein